MVGPPKTDAGIRDVAIPPHLMPCVEPTCEHTRAEPDALAVPRVRGLRPPHGSRRRSTRSTTRRGGRRPPDLRWHDLRHTGAVLAAQTGATLAELMGRLGHSTPGAAMRYQHAAADRDAEIARRLSELASGGSA